MKFSSTLIFFILAFLLNFDSIQAAKVKKVKGRKVYILTEGDSMNKGEYFYALKGGKKKGIVKILKVKGSKALGKIVKGRAKRGWPLMLRQKGKRSARKRGATPDFYIGAMGGFGMPTMDVQGIGVQDKSVNLEGSTMSVHLVADYKFTDMVWIRGLLGYDSITLEKAVANVCGVNNDEPTCTTEMSFLSAGLLARFALLNLSMFEIWVGGGSSLFLPMSSESNAIADISTMFVLTVGGGVEVHVTPTIKVPIQFDYNLIPPTDTVTNTSFITGKLGVAVAF